MSLHETIKRYILELEMIHRRHYTLTHIEWRS